MPLGTKVLIEGLDNVYTVEDKGDGVKGKHIDLYLTDLDDANAWGVQYGELSFLNLELNNREFVLYFEN